MSTMQLSPAERWCVVCGDSLEGRRPDAVTCSPKCRRARSRLLVLLAGGAHSGLRSVAQWARSREDACEAPPKIKSADGSDAPATRTARAGLFVDERCEARPGQLTIANAVYAAYVGWCETNEPDRPLSRSAFDAVVARRAPVEDRVSVAAAGRGRPRIAYRGLVIVAPTPDRRYPLSTKSGSPGCVNTADEPDQRSVSSNG